MAVVIEGFSSQEQSTGESMVFSLTTTRYPELIIAYQAITAPSTGPNYSIADTANLQWASFADLWYEGFLPLPNSYSFGILWFAVATAPLNNDQITLSISANHAQLGWVMGLAGVVTGAVGLSTSNYLPPFLDPSPTVASWNQGANSVETGTWSVATSFANELLLAFGNIQTSATALSFSSNWNSLANILAGPAGFLAWLLTTAIQSSVGITANWTPARTWAIGILAVPVAPGQLNLVKLTQGPNPPSTGAIRLVV